MNRKFFRFPLCRSASRFVLVTLSFAHGGAASLLAAAQTSPADGPWAGTVQCVLDVQTGSYTRQETQAWTLTGEAPTLSGDFRIYNATWTVTGQGSFKKSQGQHLITTTWTVNVPATPVKLAMFVRASDQKLIIRQWSSPKQVPGAVVGTKRVTINGQTGPTTPVTAPASEWSFQWIDEDNDQTTLDGSKTTSAEALPADFYFSGAPTNATCTWQFTKDAGSPPQRPPREPVPQLMTITPAAVDQGANDVLVTLTGQGTHWQTGVTTADFGSDIRVAALTVNSPTEAVARLIVSSSAPIGPRVVMVTTPTNRPRPEEVGLSDKFTVNAVLTAIPGPILIPPLETKPPVLPPPPPIGTAPTSGKYRFILNGFRVNGRTFEGVENDGTGDEVYGAAQIYVCNRKLPSGALPKEPALFLKNSTVVKSAVHGNIQAGTGRVRAGSAAEFGGLRNGDVFPTGQDPARITTNPIPRTFPLLLWEGDLSDGDDVVVIKPALWEWDGDSCVYNQWENDGISFGQNGNDPIHEKIAQLDLSPFSGGAWPILCDNYYFLRTSACPCEPGKDRPIGLEKGNEQSAWWHGQTIVFTREAIEKALNSPPQAGGPPPGVIVVHLVDTGLRFDGNYDLFLRFERVQGAPTPPPPGAPPTVDVAPPPPAQRTAAPEPPAVDVAPPPPAQRTVVPEPPTVDVAPPPPAQRTAAPEPAAIEVAPPPPAQRTAAPEPVVSRLREKPGFNRPPSMQGPAITQVSPNTGVAGATGLLVTVTGSSTHLAQGTTAANFGPGITVNSLMVASPTSATATLTIDPAAVAGPRAVTLTTGAEVATLANGFTVGARTSVSDTQPPTPATNLSATDITTSSFRLHWSSSYDSNGVAGYDAILTDAYTGQVEVRQNAVSSAVLWNLSFAKKVYRVQVRARDLAGNTSLSAVLVVTLVP